MPAASHVEKEGTFTQTQRLLQWRHKAVEPPGDARSDLWFYFHLGRILRERLKDSTDPRDRALQQLTWDYPLIGETQDPDAAAVLREINGVGPDGRALDSYMKLKDDGSTTSGCWIYCGVYADEVNQAARRKPGREQGCGRLRVGLGVAAEPPDALQPGLRRPRRPAVERSQEVRVLGRGRRRVDRRRRAGLREGEAAGLRAAGGGPGAGRDRRQRPLRHAGRRQGVAVRAVRAGRRADADALRAVGVVVENGFYKQQANPTVEHIEGPWNRENPARSDVFPFQVTTYRLTEHHTAGGMSRTLPYLSELQPEFFVEVIARAGRERGLANGEYATLISARTAIEAKVLVTERMRPIRLGTVRSCTRSDALPLVLQRHLDR